MNRLMVKEAILKNICPPLASKHHNSSFLLPHHCHCFPLSQPVLHILPYYHDFVFSFCAGITQTLLNQWIARTQSLVPLIPHPLLQGSTTHSCLNAFLVRLLVLLCERLLRERSLGYFYVSVRELVMVNDFKFGRSRTFPRLCLTRLSLY